jgi:hypothetical protein
LRKGELERERGGEIDIDGGKRWRDERERERERENTYTRTRTQRVCDTSNE